MIVKYYSTGSINQFLIFNYANPWDKIARCINSIWQILMELSTKYWLCKYLYWLLKVWGILTRSRRSVIFEIMYKVAWQRSTWPNGRCFETSNQRLSLYTEHLPLRCYFVVSIYIRAREASTCMYSVFQDIKVS